MAAGRKTVQALGWVDLETTGLPEEGDGLIDYRDVHVLEFALLVTDLDLAPLVGYHGTTRMTKEAARALKANDYVRAMHTGNNLIRDCMKSPDHETLADLEAALIDTLQTGTSFDPGEFAIAGSGVARFDHPLIKAKMPKLASWFNYAELDIGNVRRASTWLAGTEVVNPVPESSRDDSKTHRAFDDVKAHIKETKRYRSFYRDAAKALGI